MWKKLAHRFLRCMFSRNSGDTDIDVAALMEEGRVAYRTKAKCPYAKGTRERKAWMRGWTEADHENLMRW
ncbi:ribosome modulation factor [Paraburkholderia solisilvae]|uniref:Ribosome modulation factor n=1 Tax=Paraburkholderia solisilvae TaxID=624376 RepID=A0A6J5EH33_9BURK|nr:hypothetical protein [Paraburkholderia solisilvae]CAB3764522.1 hypothetical protein LMG29739_04377 [Paraburkholderia solisilvae]